MDSRDQVLFQRGNSICQIYSGSRSKGVFYGDNPLHFSTSILLLQLSLASLLTTLLQLILTPLGESAFFSQMVVGIALGPHLFGKTISEAVYPLHSHYTNETFAFFGCMFYLFVVGVRMDYSMIKRSGKKSIVIGLCTFFFPLTINTFIASAFKSKLKMTEQLRKSIIFIAAFQSLSSFHVIACLLADLKLLNSELGRLASSASMISGSLTWAWVIITLAVEQSNLSIIRNAALWMFIWVVWLMVIVLCIFRPIMKYMARKTIKDGKQVRDSYIFSILMMVLVCALISELVGQHFIMGPMLLGVAVPSGPPIGSALVHKLETFLSCVLLPAYFVFSGSKIDLSTIDFTSAGILEAMALTSFVCKVIGTMVPSLYCKMSLVDAFSLGLIMSAQGITDVLILQHANLHKLVDKESYTIIVLSMVIITGIITPLIKLLYNPSKQFKSYKRRTLLNMDNETELRMLACIHHQDQTPPIINLLEVSNPTTRTPICFYIIHLTELVGRSSPLLVFHRPGKKNPYEATLYSDHIVNAFRLYEQNNNDSVMVNAYTSISPYETMHQEVCMLALEKRVTMLILPFHKQWADIGVLQEQDARFRDVNCQIQQNAPCSVGVFVDRGTLGSSSKTLNSENQKYNIGLIFIGGGDDREALAYAIRMGNHSNTNVTVVRLMEPGMKSKGVPHLELDDKIVKEFRISIVRKPQHVYKEEIVSDSVGMIEVIRSLENKFDLIIVGSHHDKSSALFMGLGEWNEFQELGFIGDTLSNSDSSCKVSVLVVQQQIVVSEEAPESAMQEAKDATDSTFLFSTPHHYNKVLPV